jgi:hypothetical protein
MKNYKANVNGEEKLATATGRLLNGTYQPCVEWNTAMGQRHSVLLEGESCATSEDAIAVAAKYLESLGFQQAE